MSSQPRSQAVRTRFAPSPTGFLHLGGARTALFSWAYARRFQGEFVLRIEDTDLERSTPQAVQAILDGMAWLGLQWDEGPIFQTHRLDRYRQVIDQWLADGKAYRCYCTPAELDAMREAQRAAGEKPRYDGRWRPETGKVLPAIPDDVKPVIRFKNPVDGTVGWHDGVKGTIEFANAELDDLIIARPDGVPTYNFCVVVDDIDMAITHVIRGDDHVNNTPRQINLYRALGVEPPVFAHLPMILGPDGEKLSKRHGAVSVIQYDTEGYLPEAMLNYLARLGWGHGDDEIFSMQQFIAWFDFPNISASASRFDFTKLAWLNNHYLRQADLQRLAALVQPRIEALGGRLANRPALTSVIALLRDRANTLNDIADAAMLFYGEPAADAEQLAAMLTEPVQQALKAFAAGLADVAWEPAAIAALLKSVIGEFKLKMPNLAMPLRLIVTGRTQTPAIDAVLALFDRDLVLARLQPHVAA